MMNWILEIYIAILEISRKALTPSIIYHRVGW